MATTVMSEEKNPTLSFVAPLLAQLLHDTQGNIGDTMLIKDIKQSISHDLKRRYASATENTTLYTASTLDPRFKTLPFLTPEERQETYAEAVTLQVIKHLNNRSIIYSNLRKKKCHCSTNIVVKLVKIYLKYLRQINYKLPKRNNIFTAYLMIQYIFILSFCVCILQEESRQQTISEPEFQEHQEEPGYTEEDPRPTVFPAKIRKSCGLTDLLE